MLRSSQYRRVKLCTLITILTVFLTQATGIAQVTNRNLDESADEIKTTMAGTLPVTDGLYAWYTVDFLKSLSNGNPVDYWINSASNSDFDLESISSTPPTYSTTGFLGKPSIHFSTTSPMGTLANIGLHTNPEFTVIFLGIIVAPHPEGEHSHPWAWGDGSGETGYPGGASDFEIQNVGGDFRVDYATGYSEDAMTPTGSFNGKFGEPTIVSFRKYPGPLNSTTRIAIDGIDQTITGSTLIPNIFDTPFYLGPTYDQQGTKSPIMEVVEVIIFNRVVSDTEMELLHGYLMWKIQEPDEEEIVERVMVSDLNNDYYVDMRDVAVAALVWLEEDCGLSDSCGGSDVYPPGGDGEVDFRDLAVILGAWGYCVDPTNPDCVHFPLTLYEPPTTALTIPIEIIALFSGEFYMSTVDMRIRGIGLDFVWARTYRSRTGKNTSMGNNWSYSYDIHIEACSGNIILHGPTGRRDVYYTQPNGTWAARGFFREISQNPDGSFTMVFSDKGEWRFNSLDATNAPGKINVTVDRNGNAMSFTYDEYDRLVTIHTSRDDASHNRDITIAYNVDGLVESVTDHTGRQVRYEYYSDGDPDGSAGDLKSVITPAVTGTPTGNDFPGGKKTVYTYTKGFGDERLNHNLLTVIDPNGNTYLRNLYFSTQNPNDRDFDRVRRQILGEPNDIIDIRYRQCAPRPGNNYAVTVAIVNDRAGGVRHYWFDQHNRLVILREYTGFAPDPDEYTDLTRNRPVGKLRPDDPDYFETRFQYNEDHLPVRVDYPNGNYTVNVYQGPNAPPRSRGNLREIHHFAGPLEPVSDQNEIEVEFFYDTESDPCGFNVVIRSVNPRGDERLYDYDDSGNRTRTTYKRPGPKPDIVVDYEYDDKGRLTFRVLPDNGSNYRRLDEYKYYIDPNDPNYGYLKNVIIDKNNLALTTTYAYDPFGNAIRVTDPNGNDMQLIRNQRGQVVRQISRDVGGVRYERDYHYDENNNLVRVDVQNKDEAGLLRSNTHLTTTYDYGILNNLTRVTREVDPNDSIVTEYEYDDNFRRTLTRLGEATNGNQPNNTRRTIYDERGLVFRRTLAEGDPCQSTTQYDYNLNGDLKRTIRGLEGVPRITTCNRDGFVRIIETRDAMGNVGKYGYDAAGNLVSVRRYSELIDVQGSAGNVRLFESRYRYDDLNRLIESEVLYFDPNTQTPIGDGNSVRQFFYSDNGLLTKTIDDNNNHTRYVYDTAGRLSTIIDAKRNIRSYNYNKNSDLIRLIEVDKSDVDDSNETFITNFERDGLGRLIKRIDSVGNMTKYGYDSRGRCTLITDALNNKRRREFDGVGRLIRTIRDMDGDGADPNDANDIVTQYAYDDSGRCISFTDDNGNTTSSEYDALNRMTDILFADGTERKFGYDVYGNQNVAMDADGDFVVTLYDKLGRPTKKSIIPGPETANTTTFEEYKYDGSSRLVYAGNDSSTVTFKHDSLSDVVEETLNGQTTSYTHDGMGNRLSCTYPGGRVVNYVPDELNRTSILGDGLGNDLVVNKYVGRRLARADYGNGTRMIYEYDGMAESPNPAGDFGVKRIIKTTHVRIADGNTIDERIYAWDPVGTRKMQKDIRPGGPQLTYDYLYDRAYRLIQTTVTDGNSTVVRRTNYKLDGVGNREEVTGMDMGPWVGTYFMDPILPEPGDFQMNQYTSTPSDNRQYSKNGNLKIIDNGDLGINSIKYDYRNRMVEYTDGATGKRHTYSYDPLDRRICKIVDADGIAGGSYETRYLYSGGRVIEERDGTGTTQASYLSFAETLPDDIVSMQRGGQDYYYHGGNAGLYITDGDDQIDISRGGQGVMAVTDNAGNVVERYRYADYGSRKIFNAQGQQINESAIGNPYMFAGLRHDDENGFLNADGYWIYDPVAGRPITRAGFANSIVAVDETTREFGNNPWSGSASSPGFFDVFVEVDLPGLGGCEPPAEYLKINKFNTCPVACPFMPKPNTFTGVPWCSFTTGDMPAVDSLTGGDDVWLIGGGGGSGIVGLGLDVDISPGSSLTDGIVVLQVNGGQSPISGIVNPATIPSAGLSGLSELVGRLIPNRLTIPGFFTGILMNSLATPNEGARLDLMGNGGQSLSGSRGDDVWLIGGGGGSGLVTGIDISALTAGFSDTGGVWEGIWNDNRILSFTGALDFERPVLQLGGVYETRQLRPGGLIGGGGGSGIVPADGDPQAVNEGQLPILGCDDADQDGDVDGDDFLIWQTGLSGSRGDDVWLFGGAAGFSDTGSLWEDLGIRTDYSAMGFWQTDRTFFTGGILDTSWWLGLGFAASDNTDGI